MRDPEVTSGDAPDDAEAHNSVARQPSSPPWERRLSWRGRLLRGVVAILVVVIALGFVFARAGVLANLWGQGLGAPPGMRYAPAPTGSTFAPLTVRGQSFLGSHPEAAAWQHITFPKTLGRILDFTPSPTHPGEAFVCAADGPLAFWSTYDGGATWTRLPLPQSSNQGCGVVLNPARAGSFLFVATGSSPCAPPTLDLTTDDGHTWTRLTHLPAAPKSTSCLARLSLAGSSVTALTLEYATEENRLLPGPIYHSDDAGRTWTPATPRTPGTFLDIATSSDPGGMLTLGSATSSTGSESLYVTTDGGRTWATRDVLSPLTPDWLLVAPGVPLATLLASNDLIYGLERSQIPSLRYELGIVARQADGSWQSLPPLPVRGASPTRLGIADILAETAHGDLLVLGTDPNAPLPDVAEGHGILPEEHAQWLWLWDATQHRWLPQGPPLAVPLQLGAGGFTGTLVGGANPTLWLTHWTDTGADVYLETLPAALG